MTAGRPVDDNWIHSIFFDDILVAPPRRKLPQKVVESWMQNQFKQRILVLRLLGVTVSETFQQMQVLNGSNHLTPYDNDYDLMTGYDMYHRLWTLYRNKWEQQQRIFVSPSRPIVEHLAFPPKALRWHTTLDRTDHVPRDKWDKRLLLNDFKSSIRPHKHIELETMDIFDLPFGMELGDEESILLAELDQLVDFFFVPLMEDPCNSTLIDGDLVHEDLLPDISNLLTNLDLQKTEIDTITSRFRESGVELADLLTLLFDIKPQDRDLLLNKVLMLPNQHIEAISKLDTQAKQVVNNFIIDLIGICLLYTSPSPRDRG